MNIQYTVGSGITRVGVTPIFLEKKLATFFTCPTSFVHSSWLICPQKFFSFGCQPLEGVTQGGRPRPSPLVTPLIVG